MAEAVPSETATFPSCRQLFCTGFIRPLASQPLILPERVAGAQPPFKFVSRANKTRLAIMTASIVSMARRLTPTVEGSEQIIGASICKVRKAMAMAGRRRLC